MAATFKRKIFFYIVLTEKFDFDLKSINRSALQEPWNRINSRCLDTVESVESQAAFSSVSGNLCQRFVFVFAQAHTHVPPIIHGAWNGVSAPFCLWTNVCAQLAPDKTRFCVLCSVMILRVTVVNLPSQLDLQRVEFCSVCVPGDPRRTGTRQTTGYMS